MSSDLIFIVGRQRSGTTVLRELLRKHGAFDADEIFHGDLARPNRFYAFVLEKMKDDPFFVHPEQHARLFYQYVRHLREMSKGTPIALDLKYFGLNMIPERNDLAQQRPFVVRFMQESKAHVFHVIRTNKLRVLVSEIIAQRTGVWSAQRPAQLPPRRDAISLEPAETLRRLGRLEHEDALARGLLSQIENRHEFVYEQMFEADGNFTDDVTDTLKKALGIEQLDPTPTNIRMNPEPLSQLISNHQEIRETLASTGYAWMLNG